MFKTFRRSRNRLVNSKEEVDHTGCFLRRCRTTTTSTTSTTTRTVATSEKTTTSTTTSTTTTTTTTRTTTEQTQSESLNWPGTKRGDVLLIGGKNKHSIIKEIRLYNLNDKTERSLISTSKWRSYGGPSQGFYRTCVVKSRGQLYTIGGQMTKRDIYKINHNKMLKMRARLPFDFYLHQCATMGDRVWALAPG